MAFALRLDVGRAAHGVDQNLFDQPGAGTTGTGGLGVLFTSSTENSPCSPIALTMVPLHTPLQPQTSMSSGMDMALLWLLMAGIADGASPAGRAKHQVVADLRDVLALAHRRKYQPPSAVSP